MTRVVPSLGVFIGTLMFLSPLKAVLDMRKHGRLGVSVGHAVGKCVLHPGLAVKGAMSCLHLHPSALGIHIHFQ